MTDWINTAFEWFGYFLQLMVVAPAAFVLGRWALTDKEPRRQTLIGVFVWTAIMLFIHWYQLRELVQDHEEVCSQMEQLLAPKHEGESYGDFMPEACYRHSEEYAEGADQFDD